MPLVIPTRKAVVQSVRSYFLTAVPEWDTSTERRSFVGGLLKSLGSALHDWYVALRQASLQFFPQTAQGDFLTGGWWAQVTQLSPNAPIAAQGAVVFTGTAASVVPAGTKLTANGLTYAVVTGVSIVQQAIAAVSLTLVGQVATYTTAAPHLLASGQSVAIAGANQSQYNGTFAIVVISDTAFTYVITGSPATPATGTITATATYASAQIACQTTGPGGNLGSGATLQVSPVTGVNTTAIVNFDGVSGGTDAETAQDYRKRVLFALGTDFGSFSANEITILLKTIPGVTRVWVRQAQLSPPAGWPAEGQVFIAFMRDNDPNPFPTTQQVTTAFNLLMSTSVTAVTAPSDVVINSPTPQPVNVTFTAISPDTPTMRAAIRANLTQFFAEGPDYGTNVRQDDYRAAIRDTYDPQGATRLVSFTLSAPSGDVTVGATSLATLGALSFP